MASISIFLHFSHSRATKGRKHGSLKPLFFKVEQWFFLSKLLESDIISSDWHYTALVCDNSSNSWHQSWGICQQKNEASNSGRGQSSREQPARRKLQIAFFCTLHYSIINEWSKKYIYFLLSSFGFYLSINVYFKV